MAGNLKRVAVGVWKIVAGAFVCQYMVTSLLAVGWSLRLAQRTAIKRWWASSEGPEKAASFKAQCEANEVLREFRNYPNWIVAPAGLRGTRAAFADAAGFRGKWRALRRGILGGLWQNVKIGMQGIFNVYVLTILPIVLWQYGWYSGWDNSFNKGYEQFSVGVTTSFIGIGLFLAVMLYLPLAQARQAATGNWRAFYQFRLVWELVRRRRVACLLLAGLFSLVSIPLTALRIVPLGVGNSAEFAAMSDAQVLEWANNYFFFVSVVGFVSYAFLRVVAARIYAGVLLEAYQKGALTVADLGEVEGRVFAELGLTKQEAPKQRHIAVELVGKAARPPWRVAITTATVIVWFTFVAQMYVGEFFIYHTKDGFMNQALVQLPKFRHVPKHLKDAVNGEEPVPVEERGLAVASGR